MSGECLTYHEKRTDRAGAVAVTADGGDLLHAGNPAMRRPLLSILIPAYNYPEGVARILCVLRAQTYEGAEIVISDDSTSDDVETAVAPIIQPGARIRYTRNSPGLGAGANWNALLDKAEGRYCLLMHHDEFPASPQFVERILGELTDAECPDVLVLKSVLVRGAAGRNVLHVPEWLRAGVARHAPHYLFFRNVIGAPSVVVARRDIYPRFDERLTWLIDVDAYVRLLVEKRRIRFTSVSVASVSDRQGSITASIGSKLSDVRNHELAYLRSKYPRDPWLAVLVGRTIPGRMGRTLELLWWAAFKGCKCMWAALVPSPVAAEDIQRWLGPNQTTVPAPRPGPGIPASDSGCAQRSSGTQRRSRCSRS